MVSATGFSFLWEWPMIIARTQMAYADTMLTVPTVIGARLPMIAGAMATPWNANGPELLGMVTEKVDAFNTAGRSARAAISTWQTAGEANVRYLGNLSARGQFWPADYLALAEQNLAALAAMISLPGKAIAPIHSRVTANAKRLR